MPVCLSSALAMNALRRRGCSSARRAGFATLYRPSQTAATWERLQKEAEQALQSTARHFGLVQLVEELVLSHGNLAQSLAATLGYRLSNGTGRSVIKCVAL